MGRLLFIILALLALPVPAQVEMEVIPLHHQTVDRVLPVLSPLVEAGGVLTGADNQLFLRASPRNREEIKRALAAIDKPLRRLVIHVSRNRAADVAGRGSAAQVWDTGSVRNQGSGQTVQTVDGGRAFIQIGYSVPVPFRRMAVGPGGAMLAEGVVYRDIGQGFYAEPHVNGGQVTVEISQEAMSPDRYGRASAERLSTTVTGRLGQWVELGGSGRQAAGDQAGGWTLSTGEVANSRSVWLMIEEVQ